MLPATRATLSAAAAALIAVAGFLGTRYVAVAVVGLIVVTALGWPALLRASRRREASVILGVGGALCVVAVGLGRDAPYLRYMAVSVAAMVIAALVSEVFFSSTRGRAVTSVAAVTAGAIIVASGAAWVAATRTQGADELVVTAGVALAVAAIASVITPNGHLNTGIALGLATLLGGVTAGLLADLPWYAGAATGLVCATTVTLLQELTRREPQPRGWLPGAASALAPVLAAGALVYIGGILLLG